LDHLKSDTLRQKFVDPNLTVEVLDGLINKFINEVINNTYSKEGWPHSCYGVSKIGAAALTRVLINAEKREDVKIFGVDPGWCSTSMSSYQAPRSASKGAETPVWLALLPPNTPVKPSFYFDKAERSW